MGVDDAFCPECGAAAQPPLDPRFAAVEQHVARLRQELAAGRLTEQRFRATLSDLKLESDGRYWMPGGESGKWRVYDGKDWIEAAPPRAKRALQTEAVAETREHKVTEATRVPHAAARPARRRWPIVLVLLLLVGGAGAVLATLYVLDQEHAPPPVQQDAAQPVTPETVQPLPPPEMVQPVQPETAQPLPPPPVPPNECAAAGALVLDANWNWFYLPQLPNIRFGNRYLICTNNRTGWLFTRDDQPGGFFITGPDFQQATVPHPAPCLAVLDYCSRR
jgi:hypothetical protein